MRGWHVDEIRYRGRLVAPNCFVTRLAGMRPVFRVLEHIWRVCCMCVTLLCALSHSAPPPFEIAPPPSGAIHKAAETNNVKMLARLQPVAPDKGFGSKGGGADDVGLSYGHFKVICHGQAHRFGSLSAAAPDGEIGPREGAGIGLDHAARDYPRPDEENPATVLPREALGGQKAVARRLPLGHQVLCSRRGLALSCWALRVIKQLHKRDLFRPLHRGLLLWSGVSVPHDPALRHVRSVLLPTGKGRRAL